MAWRAVKRSGRWTGPFIVVALAAAACSGGAEPPGEEARSTEGQAASSENSLGFEAVLQPIGDADASLLADSAVLIAQRLESWGVADVSAEVVDGRIVARGAGIDEASTISAVLVPGHLRFRPVLLFSPDGPLTEPGEDVADGIVVLADEDGLTYELGPAALSGSGVSAVEALYNEHNGEWFVSLDLESGSEGIGAFNDMAAVCFAREPECPTNTLAVVLDGTVISAPEFMSPSFDGSVSISGRFDEGEAGDLALVLRYGALPVDIELQRFIVGR